MNGSHVAGAGVGALVGAVLVSLGGRIGLDLTNFDAATVGMAAVAAGVGVFHAVSEYGVKGIAQTVWAGRRRTAVSGLANPVIYSGNAGTASVSTFPSTFPLTPPADPQPPAAA